MIDETVLAQSVSADRSAIMDSNNRGNAGRDIINNYSTNDFYKGKAPRQIDIIKSQRAVIEKLQRQIDRMQDQMEEYQRQFSEAVERAINAISYLDDRDILRDRFINENSTNNSTHKKK